MNRASPIVDVNLFVYNGAATIGAAIESVLSQTWPTLRLTVIDNASTDATVEIVRAYGAADPRVRLRAARHNAGAVANLQRALAAGDADFVLPKTADDVLAPSFIAQTMEVLLAHPRCTMCHAGGLVFTGEGTVRGIYPASHRLHAVGDDAIARASTVMEHYASAPSFWGIYRRDALERLAPLRYTSGYDHVMLAELALYGEIRHVPDLLYLRRDFGKPVLQIARASTEAAQRALPLDNALTDLRWMTPRIANAYAHVDLFAVARLDVAQRTALMEAAPRIFRARWLPALRQEAAGFLRALPALLDEAARLPPAFAAWRRQRIAEVLTAIEAIVPEADVAAHRALAA
jgi:glycosyltransferase involved in cell wall biosynthesis